ncbi:MAG: 50S ribosomal protein L10 [Candidatus Babeliaceae bacterium]|nr:50S ribosomal protein L10 [Candidatus Babeliaceae bacterium]
MNRHDKALLIDSLHEKFLGSQSAFLVSVEGLTVGQLQTLRKGVGQIGGSVQVAKNTLLRRAAQGVASAELLQPYFSQQLAIIFAPKDPLQIAKVIYEAARGIEKLALVAGTYEGGLLDRQQFEFLATLPSREQLLAQLCAVLQGPLSLFAFTLDRIAKKDSQESLQAGA